MSDRIRQYLTQCEVATEISNRLCKIFLRDAEGRRAVLGDHPVAQHDPHFSDHFVVL
ncbi:MAG: hypothetical protein WDN69_24405 [Aliidongia sp.]